MSNPSHFSSPRRDSLPASIASASGGHSRQASGAYEDGTLDTQATRTDPGQIGSLPLNNPVRGGSARSTHHRRASSVTSVKSIAEYKGDFAVNADVISEIFSDEEDVEGLRNNVWSDHRAFEAANKVLDVWGLPADDNGDMANKKLRTQALLILLMSYMMNGTSAKENSSEPLRFKDYILNRADLRELIPQPRQFCRSRAMSALVERLLRDDKVVTEVARRQGVRVDQVRAKLDFLDIDPTAPEEERLESRRFKLEALTRPRANESSDREAHGRNMRGL